MKILDRIGVIGRLYSARKPGLFTGLVLGLACFGSGGLTTAVAAQEAVVAVIGTAATAGQEQATAQTPLTPDQAALSALLRRGGWDGGTERFYAGNGYEPVWVSPASVARRSALMSSLMETSSHALPVTRYDFAKLQDAIPRLASMSPAELAVAELDFTKSFVRYAQDISSGVLQPRKVDREIHVYPEKRDPGLLLSGLARSQDPAAWMRALAPSDPDYAALMERYQTYQALQARGGWGAQLTGRKTLRPGDRARDVTVLRDRLTAMGYSDGAAIAGQDANVQIATAETANDSGAGSISDPTVFDPALEAAVKRFQAHHGLNQDGTVGPATRAAINVDPGFRAAQIAVNLERRRWLNRELGAKHILVNLASFDMVVMDRGKRAFESRVVVGKSRKHRTPEFSDEMEVMVVNPTWHVPSSIARKEILPELQKDPTYLDRKGMRLTGVEDPTLIDWQMVTPGSFPGRIKQAPGNGNALGRVKFLFPNDHAIYLHDTPSKSLFNKDMRAYSHGCVRVQRPYEFAEYLLSAQQDDPKGYFETLLSRRKERYVPLEQHVPVHITYRTAWVDADGQDQFRGDVYGRDARVLAALAEAGVQLPAY